MLLRAARARRVPLCHTPRPFIALTSPNRYISNMATEESLGQDIVQQSALVNRLKAEGADASVFDEARKRLGELKKSLQQLKITSGGGKDAGKKKDRLLLKTAKVTSTNSF